MVGHVAWVWLGASVVMAFLWWLQRRLGDAGIVDVAWSAGLGIAALYYAFIGEGEPVRRVFLALLAGGWAFRLAAYLLRDRILSGVEDGRYQDLKAEWGDRAQRNLFWFFEFQALLVAAFSLPWLPVAYRGDPWGHWSDWLALLIGGIAVAGETLADRQLAAFRRDPRNRGQVCRSGLWRYSRHPNYFFEWVHWWTYVFLAWGAPMGWLSLLGPALMLLFLFRITGIPATEARALRSRGEAYRRYQETTSAFFPWFPKEDA
ncbi:MAG: DUF1295 domain-containing protein [Acidobacteriota bacterium]